MLKKMIPLIANLTVYPDNIQRNLELTNGLVFSQVILLHLANKGISREQAYAMVQKNALVCWQTKQSFKELVLADRDITDVLSRTEIDEIFAYDRYLENVDYILKRCGILD
jgi:adenylosuccinate lyase